MLNFYRFGQALPQALAQILPWVLTLIVLLSITACGFRPFTPIKYQGNLFDQTRIDQLKIGMNKEQVRYLVGNPIVDIPFDQNEWHYIYIMQPPKGRGEELRREITLSFEGDTLVKMSGQLENPFASESKEDEQQEATQESEQDPSAS